MGGKAVRNRPGLKGDARSKPWDLAGGKALPTEKPDDRAGGTEGKGRRKSVGGKEVFPKL